MARASRRVSMNQRGKTEVSGGFEHLGSTPFTAAARRSVCRSWRARARARTRARSRGRPPKPSTQRVQMRGEPPPPLWRAAQLALQCVCYVCECVGVLCVGVTPGCGRWRRRRDRTVRVRRAACVWGLAGRRPEGAAGREGRGVSGVCQCAVANANRTQTVCVCDETPSRVS